SRPSGKRALQTATATAFTPYSMPEGMYAFPSPTTARAAEQAMLWSRAAGSGAAPDETASLSRLFAGVGKNKNTTETAKSSTPTETDQSESTSPTSTPSPPASAPAPPSESKSESAQSSQRHTRRRRTLRPRKAAITLTPAAVAHVRALLAAPAPRLLRIGVRNRGCSGLSYMLEYVERPGEFDEVVEQDGVRVLVDSKALFSIIGSEMDWEDKRLSSRFVFKNPNI
ncbi:Iron-sulfur assembly protein 1, partial [Ascosphaera acerosa]